MDFFFSFSQLCFVYIDIYIYLGGGRGRRGIGVANSSENKPKVPRYTRLASFIAVCTKLSTQYLFLPQGTGIVGRKPHGGIFMK